MAGIKFIHTADLHLDTPFKGLSHWNTELASFLKNAVFDAFHNIIDRCLSEDVDFLLISGDIFDSDSGSLAAQLKFTSELKRLSEKNIPVYFICGNHDPLNAWLPSIQLPGNTYRFGAHEVQQILHEKEGKPVVSLHGISYPDKVVTENLTSQYILSGPMAPLSIALLHGTLGNPGPHEQYAPFKIEEITSKGFDYWALGHIHQNNVIREEDPAIVYPGNPQGRDFGETGVKGCYLVELQENNRPNISFIPTQLVRFEELSIDLSGEVAVDRLYDKIMEAVQSVGGHDDNMSYFLRITFTGRTALHQQLRVQGETEQLIKLFNEGQLGRKAFTWIDKIIVHTRPDTDFEKLARGNEFIADLRDSFVNLDQQTPVLEEKIQSLGEQFSSQAARKELPELSLQDYQEILQKAEGMLLDQLSGDE